MLLQVNLPPFRSRSLSSKELMIQLNISECLLPWKVLFFFGAESLKSPPMKFQQSKTILVHFSPSDLPPCLPLPLSWRHLHSTKSPTPFIPPSQRHLQHPCPGPFLLTRRLHQPKRRLQAPPSLPPRRAVPPSPNHARAAWAWHPAAAAEVRPPLPVSPSP